MREQRSKDLRDTSSRFEHSRMEDSHPTRPLTPSPTESTPAAHVAPSPSAAPTAGATLASTAAGRDSNDDGDNFAEDRAKKTTPGPTPARAPAPPASSVSVSIGRRQPRRIIHGVRRGCNTPFPRIQGQGASPSADEDGDDDSDGGFSLPSETSGSGELPSGDIEDVPPALRRGVGEGVEVHMGRPGRNVRADISSSDGSADVPGDSPSRSVPRNKGGGSACISMEQRSVDDRQCREHG
jgi:hypothetical protein